MKRKNQHADDDTVPTPTGGRARRCDARSKRAGRRCMRHAIKGATKCRVHLGRRADGTSHFGALNPNWKDGRAARYQSADAILNEMFQHALDEPALVDLRAEIALVTTKIQTLVAQLGHVEPASFASAVDAFVSALKGEDQSAVRLAVDRLAELRTATRDDGLTWNRIAKFIERRRKLCESQRRMMTEFAASLPKSEVVRVASALISAVTRNVRDRDALAAIDAEIRELLIGVPERVH